MSYTKGSTSPEHLYNIITKMGSNATSFHKLSGYCMGQNGIQTAAMLKDSEDGQGVLVGINPTSSNAIVSSVKKYIGHANDITYYDKVYYVVRGGSDAIKSNVIKRYNTNYNLIDGDYTFENNVTCIAHISGNYFFLGNGAQLYVCEKNDANKRFDRLKTLTLPESGTVFEGWTRQGMCYYGSRLYKVYGKKEDNRIRRNYVAKYNLKGSVPNYNGISLSGAYTCNKTSKYLFEVEGVAVSSNGSYVAADVRDTSSDHSASIYKIGFY